MWILAIAFLAQVALITAYITRHYMFTLAALYHSNEHQKPDATKTVYEPRVSVLIPAHNEEQVIERVLQRMTELTYPKEKFEVIVIDDASTDKTGIIAERFAKTHSFIHFIQRGKSEGGRGKPEALNCGLKRVSGEIIYCFDADYYPQRDVIEKLTVWFTDPKVGAVQGRVTVLNEPDSLVTRLVALERAGGYRVDQYARNELELISQFGGTVGGFRKSLIQKLGGWDPNILAEDTDLTFKIYLEGFKIKYINEAECYEEAVETWTSYWKQRSRWAKGHMQCAFRHVWPVLRSKKMRLREKVDGFLMLNIYFVPIMAALAWVIGTFLFLVQPVDWVNYLWMTLPITFYSSVGNFAPFFEVGIGAYLDGRDRICWLIPILFLTFMLNIFICTAAFLDLSLSKVTGKKQTWSKTAHNGNGYVYIP